MWPSAARGSTTLPLLAMLITVMGYTFEAPWLPNSYEEEQVIPDPLRIDVTQERHKCIGRDLPTPAPPPSPAPTPFDPGPGGIYAWANGRTLRSFASEGLGAVVGYGEGALEKLEQEEVTGALEKLERKDLFVGGASGGDKTDKRKLYASGIIPQSYDIFGKKVEMGSEDCYDEIAGTCFAGFGFKNCQLVGDAPALVNEPYDYRGYLQPDQLFCLQCCSNSRLQAGFDETWAFKCPVDNPNLTNVFMQEFRFVNRKTLSNLDMIVCPIYREREVQEIRIEANVEVEGSWTLALDDEVSEQINWNASANRFFEHKQGEKQYYDGSGKKESLEQRMIDMIEKLRVKRTMGLHYTGLNWQGKYRMWGPVDVTRAGPDSFGAYSWNVTFPQDVWNVPQMQVTPNFTQPSFGDRTNVSISTRPRKQLHGYHLTLDIAEHGSGVDYWREVTDCGIKLIEQYGEPEDFFETYTMRYGAASGLRPSRPWAVALVIAAAAWTAGGGLAGGFR